MSFFASPSTLRTPEIPGYSPPSRIWVGTGVDSGLLAFMAQSLSPSYIIASRLCHQMKVGGTALSPVFSNINGYIYWSSGSSYLYYSRSYGWIYSSGNYPGYEPRETYNNETKRYGGDSFWSGSLPGVRDGASTNFSPRGSQRNSGSSQTVEFQFQRWQRSGGQFGEYEGVGGASEKKRLGCPRWRDGSGVYYVRSAVKQNGYWNYGQIYHSNGKWLIGTQNSPSGWWEGSEPQTGGSVQFNFRSPPGSGISGANKSISFYDYIAGDEKQKTYTSEVAIWR